MIIVTGTKRSGTSMWMQILIAAGFPAFGEKFPGEWKRTIEQANPSGFFESMLRHGIYYRTNPHPKTGAYFFPEQVKRHLVKVFIPGLVRSDRAYIGSVVATMREWREYEASLNRLHAMEIEDREKRGVTQHPVYVPPALEWWMENFSLMRDIAIRRFRVHVQTYDGLLADPEKVIRSTLKWVGDDEVDTDAAVAAVNPKHRTQKRPESDTVEPEIAAIFDNLYDTVHRGEGLTRPFVEKLNETNEKLMPRIRDAQKASADDLARRRAAGRTRPEDPPPEEAPADDPRARSDEPDA